MSAHQIPVSGQGPTVLIIEDDSQVAELQQVLLAGAGFIVQTANSGPDGLRLAQTKVFATVVLDASLPGMDGFEVCRQLKADPKTKGLPVLMCSGSPNASVRAYQAGADDFLAKPGEVMQLPVRVARLLRT